MEQATLSPGARLDDRYELSVRVADDTFGEVWRATDTRMGSRPVVVKVLTGELLSRPDMVARFEAEADALARLGHPNVVSVLDRGRPGGARYVVTEFIDGESLSAWLDRARAAGSLPGVVTVRALFDQVCAGLEAAHQIDFPGPVVHRDLRPACVAVRALPNGETLAKVSDFGVAQLVGRTSTPRYAAPEQAMGQVAGVGPWSDVFSLAVLLVEMLTLRSNSVGEETWWGTSLRTAGNVLPLLTNLRAEVPTAVWVTLAQALQADPSRRPPNAGALRAALRSAWEHVATTSAPMTMAMSSFPPVAPQTMAVPGFAMGGAAAPWPQRQFPQPMHPPAGASTSSSFAIVVMSGLFLALMGATAVWMTQRSNRARPAVLAMPVPAAPYVPPAPYIPPVPPTRPGRAPEDPDRIYLVRDNPTAPSLGPADAPVTVQCFSDFQCPFCGRVNPTLDRVRQTYGNRVRIVWRNYPLSFHVHAMPAAEAAVEVRRELGDAGFWRYHALLFQNQAALSTDDLARYAEAVGAHAHLVRESLDDHRHESKVRDDIAAFDASGASAGTPSFFINGRMLRGAQPYERFAAAIDRALHDALRNP